MKHIKLPFIKRGLPLKVVCKALRPSEGNLKRHSPFRASITMPCLTIFVFLSANLQFRTLPRQHLGSLHRNPNDNTTLVSVIPSPSAFISGSVMGHHTIRRPTQSGLVETVPTSMSTSFYPRNPPLAINTSQHQQFFYG